MAQTIQRCFARYEKKYLISPAQYRALTAGMAGHMRPDEYGRYTICNLYYDTPQYDLIRASLDKPVYKEKLRVRSYGVPGDRDPVFVELKKKFDGVVYKRRTLLPAAEAAGRLTQALGGGRGDQICREIDWFLSQVQPEPRVFIAYDREALAGVEDDGLRVTFDTSLRWRNWLLDLRAGDHGTLLLPSDTMLMEIKIPGAAPLWLSRLLSRCGVFPTTFSKYGLCYRRYLAAGLAEEVRSCA